MRHDGARELITRAQARGSTATTPAGARQYLRAWLATITSPLAELDQRAAAWIEANRFAEEARGLRAQAAVYARLTAAERAVLGIRHACDEPRCCGWGYLPSSDPCAEAAHAERRARASTPSVTRRRRADDTTRRDRLARRYRAVRRLPRHLDAEDRAILDADPIRVAILRLRRRRRPAR